MASLLGQRSFSGRACLLWQDSLLLVTPGSPDVFRGITIGSGEEAVIPGLLSFIHPEIRKCVPWVIAVIRCPATTCSLSSGILDQLAFLLSPFRVLLCLPLTLFPQFIRSYTLYRGAGRVAFISSCQGQKADYVLNGNKGKQIKRGQSMQ